MRSGREILAITKSSPGPLIFVAMALEWSRGRDARTVQVSNAPALCVYVLVQYLHSILQNYQADIFHQLYTYVGSHSSGYHVPRSRTWFPTRRGV